MMTEYDVFLDLLAGHPGASRSELRELTAADYRLDPDAVNDLLDDALVREDVLEANDHYWVMRTGRFAPEEYDHPLTGEWHDDNL